MQTALYVPDGWVDSVFAVRAWLNHTNPCACHIPVVLPCDQPSAKALHTFTHTPAKQAAQERLAHWLVIVAEMMTADIQTEVLFASPAQALTIHLLVRRSNCLLLDNWLAQQVGSLLLLSARMETRVLSVDIPVVEPDPAPLL